MGATAGTIETAGVRSVDTNAAEAACPPARSFTCTQCTSLSLGVEARRGPRPSSRKATHTHVHFKVRRGHRRPHGAPEACRLRTGMLTATVYPSRDTQKGSGFLHFCHHARWRPKLVGCPRPGRRTWARQAAGRAAAARAPAPFTWW